MEEAGRMIVENRWSWGRQITLAIVLFLLFNLMSFLFYNATFIDQAIADTIFALLALGLTVWALKSTKVFIHRLTLNRPLLIWGLVCLVALGIVFAFADVPQHIIMVFQTNHLLVNTLIALAAAIFEESICRGLFLSAFLAHAQYNGRSYKLTRSAIYSSVLFGIFHLVNLFGGNPGAVFQQIFWAFVLGVFLSALRLTTNSLVWPMLIHFLLDWFPSAATQLDIKESSWALILIIFGFLLVVSLVYLVQLDRALQSQSASHGKMTSPAH